MSPTLFAVIQYLNTVCGDKSGRNSYTVINTTLCIKVRYRGSNISINTTLNTDIVEIHWEGVVYIPYIDFSFKKDVDLNPIKAWVAKIDI